MSALITVLLAGSAVGYLAVATIRALRRAWAASAPAAIESVLGRPATDADLLRRTTHEEIEAAITAGLFAGEIEPRTYRRSLELLARNDERVPASAGPERA